MPYPTWCRRHLSPESSEPGDQGAHFGKQMSVLVTKRRGLVADQLFVVQVAAHDYRGRRETMIYLDNPGRGIAQMTAPQAKATAANLLQATEIHAATDPLARGCPTSCIERP
ncbi:DUF6907 domain-containing protein [Nocardia takedensis]